MQTRNNVSEKKSNNIFQRINRYYIYVHELFQVCPSVNLSYLKAPQFFLLCARMRVCQSHKIIVYLLWNNSCAYMYECFMAYACACSYVWTDRYDVFIVFFNRFCSDKWHPIASLTSVFSTKLFFVSFHWNGQQRLFQLHWRKCYHSICSTIEPLSVIIKRVTALFLPTSV